MLFLAGEYYLRDYGDENVFMSFQTIGLVFMTTWLIIVPLIIGYAVLHDYSTSIVRGFDELTGTAPVQGYHPLLGSQLRQ